MKGHVFIVKLDSDGWFHYTYRTLAQLCDIPTINISTDDFIKLWTNQEREIISYSFYTDVCLSPNNNDFF